MPIVIVGDLHLRSEEPFYSVSKKFFEWFISQDFNNENNILIQLGDILHNSVSNGKVNHLMLDLFFNKLKFKEIYALTGNHDLSKRGGNGLLPLLVNKKIKLFTEITIQNIENYNCLFVPFTYNNQKLLESLEQLKKESKTNFDFIFTHLGDETQKLFDNYIDLSFLHGIKIFGHIHLPSKHYIGTPYITKYDERGKESYIGIINDKRECKKIEVPKFLEYMEIKYGEKIESKNYNIPYIIWDIIEAPDKDSAYSFYSNIYIRKVITKQDELINETINKNRDSSLSIKDCLLQFITTNNIEGKLKNLLITNID